MSKKRALGKGLHSLLPQRPPEMPVTELPVDQIRANPHQPRRQFRDQQLLELALSISAEGIIQPLIVRRAADGFELVAGERRLRAAKLAGLERVPVVVQAVEDHKLLELALIENIQREDLNPIELALAFERMAADLGLSHDEIGARTGKDRATVTNTIRLLQLPPDIQQLLAERKLSAGHARALLKLPTAEAQREAAHRALDEGWTVRQAEERTKSAPRQKDDGDPNVRAAVADIEKVLGTRVRITDATGGRGKIEIEYYSPEDLHRIYGLITQAAG